MQKQYQKWQLLRKHSDMCMVVRAFYNNNNKKKMFFNDTKKEQNGYYI